jgi:hypothetical protein
VEVPLSQPRHKSCAVTIDNSVVVTGGTSLGLGKFKPQFLAEIGTRRTEMFDGQSWLPLPSMSRAKVKTSCCCIQEISYVLLIFTLRYLSKFILFTFTVHIVG